MEVVLKRVNHIWNRCFYSGLLIVIHGIITCFLNNLFLEKCRLNQKKIVFNAAFCQNLNLDDCDKAHVHLNIAFIAIKQNNDDMVIDKEKIHYMPIE